MKEVINLQGAIELVPVATTVKTVNGKHYLLTPADEAEIAQREADYDAKAPERALAAVIAARKAEYGTVEQQLENIIENGLAAEQVRVAGIKEKYPKPV